MGLLGKKNKPQANTTTSDFDLNDMGVMPTMKRQVLGNGMILGLEENSVWLYGKVPTAPVADARDSQRRLEAYRPLFETLDQIAADTPRAAVKRRSVAKNAYRKVHILRTNVPKTWHADVIAPRERRLGQDTLNQWLNSSLPETTVKQSILTLGVQLVPSTISTGFKGALDSVTFTLLEGGTPLVDYDRDLEKMKRIFDRTGVDSLSGSEIASLDSWWNPGRNPDVVTLSHPDHLHVIRDKRTTRAIKKMEADGVDCEDWPDDIRESPDQNAGQAVVSFGSISDLQLNFTDPVQDPQLANWALPLLDAGAMAVSIRGAVEPAEITREELRRNKRGYQNDIQERVKNNKMEKQEQEEKVEVLGQVESVYANRRGTPTLISASGLVAFDGKVEDWDTVVRSAAELQAMEHRQSRAWAEMMICSMRTANPNLMDMPIQNLACSGINDVSKVGDKWGIVRGFTESDKQPAYYNVEEAYGSEDAAPMSANIGSSGSGKTLLMQWEMFQTNLLDYPQIVVDPKALELDTPVPTPGGWSTIGELKTGDEVFGRDGKPAKITAKSEVFDPETLQMYEVRLSSGEAIRADSEHLWVTATPSARSAIARGAGMTPEQLLEAALVCGHLAQDPEVPEELPTSQMITLLRQAGCDRWTQGEQLRRDLSRAALPVSVRQIQRKNRYYWKVRHALLAMAFQAREEASAGSEHYTVLTTQEMVERAGTRNNDQTYFALPANDAIQLPEADLPVPAYLLGAWLGDGGKGQKSITVGKDDATEMIEVIRQEWPWAKLVEAGHHDLIECVRDPQKCLYGHQDYAIRPKKGRESGAAYCRSCYLEYGSQWKGRGSSTWGDREITNPSLHHLLEEAGVLANKHIPAKYLRASFDQRLALLQGLMDTDGTVKPKRGQCKISQSNPELADQIAELVRSLGIQVSTTVEPSAYRDDDGRLVQCRDAYGVVFQTDVPVFRLPRKRDIQPQPGFRSKWVYVKDIVPVEARPAQCIRVDSGDHTFLAGEAFTATHNTKSDLTPVVEAMPNGRVYSLDELSKYDGIFDAVRFSPNPDVAVEFALATIATLNPYGTSGKMSAAEPDLIEALHYGISKGHRSTLTALNRAVRDGVLEEHHVTQIEKLSKSSPMFSALVGHSDEGEGLGSYEGTTLIKVGDQELNLPEPGAEPSGIIQRINLALVRNIVFASAMALNKRKGVLRLDEAWVFTSNSPRELERLGRLARSQTIDVELYTQRISDALDANLRNYLTRGLILHMRDPVEAKAACAVFDLEASEERIGRIRAAGTLDNDSASPNFNSLKALKDPVTREVIRGSVGLYVDIHGRVVPVEIRVPDRFLKLASTNISDIEAREAEADELAREEILA